MTRGKPEAHCYAVRRVNPFEGVLQVVETPDARAYSPNGYIWQVQVLTRRPDHTWHNFSDVTPVEQFFNFGLWDAEGGLQRIPANPVMDIGGMMASAERLVADLEDAVTRLPFPLIDDFECWATDHRGTPVALLAASEDAAMLCDIRPGRWQATRIADHGFVSSTLLACGIPAHGDLGPRQHAEQLERRVRQRGQHKAWFRRLADGSAEPVDNSGTTGRLPADAFPQLGLRQDWDDDQTRALVEDYLAWLAPRLLTLQRIDDAARNWLEPRACEQAVELAAIHRLIPQVLDHERIEAARVEARLRRSAT